MAPVESIVWDPDGPSKPFDWRWALVIFMMHMEEGQADLFADMIHRWQPAYDLKEGEVDDLRAVETIVRDLWTRYGPQKPSRARLADRAVEADNAGVDAYVRQKDQFWSAVLRFMVSDEWQVYFPLEEHPAIERARNIIKSHGGADNLEELM